MKDTKDTKDTTQVNFRCTPEFKQSLSDEAWRRRISSTELLKQAFWRFIETSSFLDK